MKVNQSLTAAITAAALVIGAGFAYAQTPSTAPGSSGEALTQGNTTGQPSPATGTVMQNQPSPATGPSSDSGSTAAQSDIVTPAPRADRN